MCAVTKNAILKAQEKYTPDQIVMINSTIRRLAKEHYKYGQMPLCIGKAKGIQNILGIFYNADVSLHYVWNVIEDFHHEQMYEE